MKRYINGREVTLPDNGDGTIHADAIHTAAGIDPSRLLVVKHPDGRASLVQKGGKAQIPAGSHIEDLPLHTRGNK